MQALFLCLAFAAHAAAFIEANLAAVAFLVAVLVAHLAVPASDLVRLTQGALYVLLRHAWANSLADDGAASFAATELIAATVLMFAHHCQLTGFFFFAPRALLFAGLCRRHSFAATGGRIVSVLELPLLLAGAALQGEGWVSARVFAAIYGGGESIAAVAEQERV